MVVVVIIGRSRTVFLSFSSRDSGYWRMQHHLNSPVRGRKDYGRGGLFAYRRIHIVIVVGVIIAWASLPENIAECAVVGWVSILHLAAGSRVSSPPWSGEYQPIVCLCS